MSKYGDFKKIKNYGEFECFSKNSFVQIAVPFLLGAKLQNFEKSHSWQDPRDLYIYIYRCMQLKLPEPRVSFHIDKMNHLFLFKNLILFLKFENIAFSMSYYDDFQHVNFVFS